jgi:hypothetical protein
MVNGNHFQFDRKNFFNFWKMIYGFENCKSFFEIKLFILVRTFDIQLPNSGNSRLSESRKQHPATVAEADIPDSGWNPAMVRSLPDLAQMAGIRPFIQLDLAKMTRIRPFIQLDLAKMARIQPNLDGSSHLSNQIRRSSAKPARQNPAKATERCRISAAVSQTLFFPHVIFSCEPNTEKYF